MEARPVIYAVKCSCGFVGDTFAKLGDMDSRGRVPCPKCGQHTDQDYSRKTISNGNREFRGKTQRSLTEGWCVDEVAQVQREMIEHGDVDAANMIDPKDGSVSFKSREEQRKYMAAKARIWQRVQDGPSEAPSMEALQERNLTKQAAKTIMKRAKSRKRRRS